MPKSHHSLDAYQGEIAALISSLAIAITPYFFVHGYSQKCSPYLLNFWKGLISIILFSILLLITRQSFFPSDDWKTYSLLIASGFFGIGLGDTFYFQAFEILGPRWAVLLETITPTFTGFISYFYFGTTLTGMQWFGMIITGIGVVIVATKQEDKQDQEQEQEEVVENEQNRQIYISQLVQDNQLQEIKTQDNLKYKEEQNNNISQQVVDIEELQNSYILVKTPKENHKFSKEEIIGILKGVCFAFFQALGIVLASDSAQKGVFTPIQTSFIRILTGQLYIAVVMLVSCEKLFWPSKNKEETFYFLGGIGSCSILAIWAEQTSLKYVRPEISQNIIAISPLISLLIGCARRDHIHIKDILGSLVSIIGVSMVIWL